MIKKFQDYISLFIANHRLALWILLVVLSCTVLVFPVNVSYVYSSVESASIFGTNILLFGIIYCIWSLILFLLLFVNAKNNEWQRLGLLCLFSLVFLGFWAIKTPTGAEQDEVWNLAHVKYLIDVGKIVLDNPNLIYFQFPIFHLDIYTISQVTGIGLFATKIIFLILSSVLLACLLYMLFSRILKDSWFISLAVILMLQGSLLSKWEVFWPGNLAFLFLTALLALLYWRDDKPMLGVNPQSALLLIMLIVFVAFVITYLPTPGYFIFIVLGIYLLQIIVRKEIVRPPFIILFTLLFVAWIIYWAFGFWGSIASFIPTFLKALADPLTRFSAVSSASTGYVGENIPLWASLTRYFWLALIFGVGGILGIWKLVKVRGLGTIETIEIGGLVGVVAFTILIYLAVPQVEWNRIMVMAPLFTIPIIVGYILSLNRHNELISKSRPLISERLKNYIPALMVVGCLVLSLPTFLTHETSFTTIAIYPYDISTGEYLGSIYGNGNRLSIYSSSTAYIYTYYVPEAQYNVTDDPETFVRGNALWQNLNQLETDFANSHDPAAVFVLTERFRGPSGYPEEIQTNDPNWISFVGGLEEHNRIYVNNYDEIYGY